MEKIKNKPDSLATTRTSSQQWPARASFVGCLDDPTYFDDVRSATTFARPMLLVKKVSGSVLVGTGIAAVIGSVLIECSCLLRGPSFILGMLG